MSKDSEEIDALRARIIELEAMVAELDPG